MSEDGSPGAIEDLETALKVIAELREESAKARVKNRTTAEELDALKAASDEAKQTLASATEEIGRLRESLSDEQRTSVAVSLGVPQSMIKYVDGGTRDEMVESAKRILSDIGQKPGQPPVTSFFGGQRGEPVGGKSPNPDDALRDAILQSRRR